MNRPSKNPTKQHTLIPTGDATAMLPVDDHTPPIKVIGNEAIRETFDNVCLQQAINSRKAPGVTQLVLNPDAHLGYGAPVGCAMASPTHIYPAHIYPGPVGVDIKCSMSLLQLDLEADAIDDRKVRRALISAICQRTPTGAGKGQRNVPKARATGKKLGKQRWESQSLGQSAVRIRFMSDMTIRKMRCRIDLSGC